MPRRAGEGGNLDPERIVFNEDEIHGLAPVLRLYLLGRSIPIRRRARAQLLPLPFTLTLTFIVDPQGLPESYVMRYGKWHKREPDEEEEPGPDDPIAVSIKMNRQDLLQRLAEGQTMEEIFDFQIGQPRGTTERVYELAVRPSVGG